MGDTFCEFCVLHEFVKLNSYKNGYRGKIYELWISESGWFREILYPWMHLTFDYCIAVIGSNWQLKILQVKREW